MRLTTTIYVSLLYKKMIIWLFIILVIVINVIEVVKDVIDIIRLIINRIFK
jgi:hypothetical protein